MLVESLKKLLQICTKKTPFINHNRHMCKQQNWFIMGSPLGVLFANFYIGIVEEHVFFNLNVPLIYCWYADDTFIPVGFGETLMNLGAPLLTSHL